MKPRNLRDAKPITIVAKHCGANLVRKVLWPLWKAGSTSISQYCSARAALLGDDISHSNTFCVGSCDHYKAGKAIGAFFDEGKDLLYRTDQ